MDWQRNDARAVLSSGDVTLIWSLGYAERKHIAERRTGDCSDHFAGAFVMPFGGLHAAG